MTNRVLLVVDDPRDSRPLSEELVRSRFPTDVCLGLRTATEKLRQRRYDAIVLEIDAAPPDAVRLALELRSRTDAPIVFVSRRQRTHAPAAELGYAPLHDGLDAPRARTAVPENAIRVGDFLIDLAAMRATVGGTAIDLTPTEFKLLVALAERPGSVLSREELLLRVWKYTDGDGGRLVDVHVGRLRKKLRAASVDEVRVETARGFGYRLVESAGVPVEAGEMDGLTRSRP